MLIRLPRTFMFSQRVIGDIGNPLKGPAARVRPLIIIGRQFWVGEVRFFLVGTLVRGAKAKFHVVESILRAGCSETGGITLTPWLKALGFHFDSVTLTRFALPSGGF